jgi:cytochrome o ubiquinol oxidase subunit 3
MLRDLAIHHKGEPFPDTRTPDPHQDVFSKNVFGFWLYLMTDCLLFGTLFCTYGVLHNSTFGGPTTKDLYDLGTAFTETLILLFSSVACGFAVLSSLKNHKNWVIGWLVITFLLGASFVGIELNEFADFVKEGNSWERSAFLSSFFALVGTHGTHVSFGLLWIAVLIGQVFAQGINSDTFRRLVIFSMFWHFLDLIWIFIFTFVYLMGVI